MFENLKNKEVFLKDKIFYIEMIKLAFLNQAGSKDRAEWWNETARLLMADLKKLNNKNGI